MSFERLDKILSSCGIASRTEAQSLIRQGFVTVDGTPAKRASDKYDAESSEIRVKGEMIRYSKNHFVMMNKPAGVISATEDPSEKTVTSLLSGPLSRMELFPAGRLDKDAEGLLILTDDGGFAHRMLAPKNHVDKKYYIETDGAVSDSDRQKLETGLTLKDGLVCLPAFLEILESGESSKATIVIHEGKYHQVKRMMASLGKPVTYLKRLSIGGLELDRALKPGQWREMTEKEAMLVFKKDEA